MTHIINRILNGEKVGSQNFKPLCNRNMRKDFPCRYTFGVETHTATGLPMPPKITVPQIVYVYIFVGVQ